MNHAHVDPENELRAFLRHVHLADPIELGDVTLVPICCATQTRRTLALLEDALEHGTAITEVSREGVVGRVRVEHRGPHALLLLQGEQLLGARQHRMLNDSQVIEPGTSVIVPVSCVERGRWREESAGFAASETTMPPSIRATSHRMSTSSRIARGTPDVDQGAVWTGVRELLHSTQTGSRTEAFDDVTRARRDVIAEKLAAIPAVDGQVGVAAVHADQVFSVELLGSAEIFARARRKVLRGLLGEPRSAALSPHAKNAAMAALRAIFEAAAQRIDEGSVTRIAAVTPWGSVSAVGHRGTLAHALITAV